MNPPPQTTSLEISVLIPAHNPDRTRLREVLLALRAQKFPVDRWETVLIDNASSEWPTDAWFAECAPRNLSIVSEPRLGLSAARRRGLSAARGDVAIFVDDDNVLEPDYLTETALLFSEYPKIGVAGGKSVPRFENGSPPDWSSEFHGLLALRDLGSVPLVSEGLRSKSDNRNHYPPFAPIGAGMALRRAAWASWIQHGCPDVVDRRGDELSSGGDNDIVLCALHAGWEVGYFPRLKLNHLIPARRLDPEYLGRLNRAIQRSWMQVLAFHEACPWPPLTPLGALLRKLKAWFAYQPWRSPAARIRYLGACGHFEGRVPASIADHADATSVVRSTARQLGLGRLNYLAWHAPLAVIRHSRAAGGPAQQWIDWRGRGAMERAAAQLRPLDHPCATELPELHFLTGRKFWYQTAFCLHSLQEHSRRTFSAVMHDDGTLGPELRQRLQTLFPRAKIRTRAEMDEFAHELLPEKKFPCLHDRRRNYPNILKLTDTHLGATGWRLVLDSDMLFFRAPDAVLAWLAAPDRPMHLIDIADSYGYSRDLLERVSGTSIPSKINVGLAGLRSDAIDWEEVENWCRQLMKAEGTSYYLEQALIAMLLARAPHLAAPAHEYIVCPAREDCFPPRGVLHHYVAESKRWYFRHTWRVCTPST
jgi:glycosyltransferase involved in cell wall biosynthesis